MASINLFTDTYEGLLPEVPKWVIKAVDRRLRSKAITVVSAVCPDYEICNGKFTYQGLGQGLPYTAAKHLEVMVKMKQYLDQSGIELIYHITLADTEFDLPLVVDHMTNGDVVEFLRRCQESCEKLITAASNQNLPLINAARFTDVFPDWFPTYERAKQQLRQEILSNADARYRLYINACNRVSLYRAMTGSDVSTEYCKEMVLRQNAQYMAWGECATSKFGNQLIMVNHTTSNLDFVNNPLFRQGRERIPILQLSITTLPE